MSRQAQISYTSSRPTKIELVNLFTFIRLGDSNHEMKSNGFVIASSTKLKGLD